MISTKVCFLQFRFGCSRSAAQTSPRRPVHGTNIFAQEYLLAYSQSQITCQCSVSCYCTVWENCLCGSRAWLYMGMCKGNIYMVTWHDMTVAVLLTGNVWLTNSGTDRHCNCTCILCIWNAVVRSAVMNMATIGIVEVVWDKFNGKEWVYN
jgi:hypothetical protein